MAAWLRLLSTVLLACEAMHMSAYYLTRTAPPTMIAHAPRYSCHVSPPWLSRFGGGAGNGDVMAEATKGEVVKGEGGWTKRVIGSMWGSMATRRAAESGTRMQAVRERVHISRTDRPPEGEGSPEEARPKPVPCITFTQKQRVDRRRGGAQHDEGGAGEEHVFLGNNAQNFLRYVQQELKVPTATEDSLKKRVINDLTKETEWFSQLWRSGRLVVEDPNTLDVINNKTSFQELLLAYTHRMKKTDDDPTTCAEIREFLTQEYGADATAAAIFREDRPPQEAMANLKHLLQWFRSRFPYYKSTCLHCGNADGNSMIGVVFPSDVERAFNATVTELYCCSKCHTAYRFPRSVVISKVIETRRGRCGEYSRLFFKAMEALNYRARWVVDWEDHVWVEVDLPGRGWVHLDPCEAAVDEPLLYQSWGKNQTYILAFTREEVADVTHVYTSDFEAAKSRRKVTQEEFDALLERATCLLQDRGVCDSREGVNGVSTSSRHVHKERGGGVVEVAAAAAAGQLQMPVDARQRRPEGG